MAKPKMKRNSLKLKSGKYRWSDKERDPEMLYLIEKTREDERSITHIADAAYLSHGTLRRALDGNTARPQNYTLTAWATALDIKRAFVDKDGKVHVIAPWQARINAMKKRLQDAKKANGGKS